MGGLDNLHNWAAKQYWDRWFGDWKRRLINSDGWQGIANVKTIQIAESIATEMDDKVRLMLMADWLSRKDKVAYLVRQAAKVPGPSWLGSS